MLIAFMTQGGLFYEEKDGLGVISHQLHDFRVG